MDDKERWELDNLGRIIDTLLQARKEEILHKLFSEDSITMATATSNESKADRLLKEDSIIQDLQNEKAKLRALRTNVIIDITII